MLFARNIIRQNLAEYLIYLTVFAERNEHANIGILIILAAVAGITDYLKPYRGKAENSLNKPLGNLYRLDSIVAEGIGMLFQNSVGYLNVISLLCD